MKPYLFALLLSLSTQTLAQSDTATTLTHNESIPWLPIVLIVIGGLAVYWLIKRGRK